MVYKVELSQFALADLRHIDGYLRERSPSGADNVKREIQRTLALLANFPMIGTKLRLADTRYVVTRRYRYRIVFRVTEETVLVLKVYHRAQNVRDR